MSKAKQHTPSQRAFLTKLAEPGVTAAEAFAAVMRNPSVLKRWFEQEPFRRAVDDIIATAEQRRRVDLALTLNRAVELAGRVIDGEPLGDADRRAVLIALLRMSARPDPRDPQDDGPVITTPEVDALVDRLK